MCTERIVSNGRNCLREDKYYHLIFVYAFILVLLVVPPVVGYCEQHIQVSCLYLQDGAVDMNVTFDTLFASPEKYSQNMSADSLAFVSGLTGYKAELLCS